MIYDYSKGFENAAVIVADTGKLSMSDDKKNLILTLFSGESFENLETRKTRSINENVRYRRETFSLKRILIPFDANFNMVDESITGSRDLGKNIPQLTHFIDSVSYEVDSLDLHALPYFKDRVYVRAFKQPASMPLRKARLENDSLFAHGFQVFFDSLGMDKQLDYVNRAKSKVDNIVNEYSYNASIQQTSIKQIRGHKIELQKKFTFSIACLLFFFIGAPLGAIIRKGGIGMPVVLSVFLFLFYYTIDTLGLKLARQGVVSVWEGMWLSGFVLASLGAFFTYKAVNDSVIMNPDAWKILLQRFMGKRETRNYSKKEIVMNPPDYATDREMIGQWDQACNQYLTEHPGIFFSSFLTRYVSFWKRGFYDPELNRLVDGMENWIEDLLNSEENLILNKLMDYPIVKPWHGEFFNKPFVRKSCGIVFPVGLFIYLLAVWKQKKINDDLQISRKVNDELKDILYAVKYD
jgi:lipopolysaccharide export system permease protein